MYWLLSLETMYSTLAKMAKYMEDHARSPVMLLAVFKYSVNVFHLPEKCLLAQQPRRLEIILHVLMVSIKELAAFAAFCHIFSHRHKIFPAVIGNQNNKGELPAGGCILQGLGRKMGHREGKINPGKTLEYSCLVSGACTGINKYRQF